MQPATQVHAAYTHETASPDRLWLIQPTGGGAVTELTWGQGMDQARRMAAHLRSLDLPPGSRIALFSKNTAWWILADLAIWMAGHVSVPLFPTLTPDSIGQVLSHSEAELIFIGKLDGFESMEPGIPASLPRIVLPLAPATSGPTWQEIIAATDPIADSPVPSPEDLATIVYTSGSTGQPKGVMHSFATMTHAALGIGEVLDPNQDDRMLSYLPLAHVFERWVVETGTLMAGFRVFFAQSLDTFVTDLTRARPTLFVSVPRLWQKFQMGVSAKMPPQRLSLLLKIPVVSGIIRKKILSGLGLDAVRFAGSGSAPIPKELIEWYRALGLELLEGYGMSENFCYSHVSKPGQVRVGYVGSTYPGVECRISEQGEILVKSPATMLGYYKEPALTAEVMTEDGFLRTGDRGAIDDQGRLRITGRVKELFKTSKGKYVAPAPIENRLQVHADIEACCVSGSGQPQPFGMVVLSDAARARTEDPDARAALERALAEHLQAVNADLDHHEHLQLLTVVAEPWTIENGMLTPTMKLKRQAIEDRYGPHVDGWYERKSRVIWA